MEVRTAQLPQVSVGDISGSACRATNEEEKEETRLGVVMKGRNLLSEAFFVKSGGIGFGIGRTFRGEASKKASQVSNGL